MNGLRSAWLVAAREIRERLRSPVYFLSLGLMLVAVIGAIMAPSLINDGGANEVGIAGQTQAGLVSAIRAQADAAGAEVNVGAYDASAAGEQAVRDGKIDVLVVDGRRLEWRGAADEELEGVLTGAIQGLAIRERAVAAGIDPDVLRSVLAPVAVESRNIGQVAGRTSDDETATYLLSLVLFLSVSIYGGMVLTGVVEEKSSRVVEVLLARIPPWSLLVGKIAGIGLLGLAQVAITGVGAVVAVSASDIADIPAVRAGVVAWAVVWFVLGYALIATAYGVLGSLISRSEDASTVTAPLTVVLIAAYFAAFATIGSADEWARLVSWFPVTAPFAMPNRIAMGATTWWEPYLAVVLTLAAIVGLVVLGGRVYTHAILRTGAVVKLSDAWRGTTARRAATRVTAVHPGNDRRVEGMLATVAAALGVTTGIVVHDVVLGVAVAAIFFALTSRLRKLHR